MGYNHMSFQLSAEDVVWKKLYEKHKSAKTFRKKGCKHYDKLCTIYGDTTAIGASSHPSTKSPSESEDEDDTDGEGGDSRKQCEEGPKNKNKIKPNVNRKKLRDSVNVGMADALIVMDFDIEDILSDSDEEDFQQILTIYINLQNNGLIADRFQHSLESTHRHFGKVLYAIASLSKHWTVPPAFDETPPEIKNNPRYYPIFKELDGTHVSARVPQDDQIPYRGKEKKSTMNVMCACSFDMKFTFVMAGWEGSANDSRIFWETITNVEETKFPMPPTRKYYLVDSGYTNIPGFLPPYRGERYHLRDYRGATSPQGPEEIFNYTHSSLRNVIEICFGDGDPLFIQYADENVELEDDAINNNGSEDLVTPSVSQQELQRMAQFRDHLATRLWERQNS
ncbi:uncharacterized protein LOC110733849 [Chenopodium quinoa]|nr:uncharacterized protein LOC110733849 [Chenopodium quinoa]